MTKDFPITTLDILHEFALWAIEVFIVVGAYQIHPLLGMGAAFGWGVVVATAYHRSKAH